MLQYPSDATPYRLVGVDPGSDTLGVAVLDLDLGTDQITLMEARTFSGVQLSRAFRHVQEVHGDRAARLMAHEENLYQYFCYTQPHNVASEGPFMSRFPQAFATLTLCVENVRRALYRYYPFLPLVIIDPPTVKLSVGVRGKGTTKDDVKVGLKRIIKEGRILNTHDIDIDVLDEHSIDAIVVAYTQAKYIIDQF